MRSMLSKSSLPALRDILHYIELAERFVMGFDNKAIHEAMFSEMRRGLNLPMASRIYDIEVACTVFRAEARMRTSVALLAFRLLRAKIP
jgi:hypothetical protein